jgi:hypothetical protein
MMQLLPWAANKRSAHTAASTQSHLTGLQASASCLVVFGTNEAKLNSNCIGIDISHPAFLPPFPRPGFANQDSQ